MLVFVGKGTGVWEEVDFCHLLVRGTFLDLHRDKKGSVNRGDVLGYDRRDGNSVASSGTGNRQEAKRR